MPMMLCDVAGVVVTRGQILLQVLLDVVAHTKPLHHIENAVGIIFPIRVLGHGQVVSPPDFVKVYKLMSMLDDSNRGVAIKRRLKRNPCEDARFVELAQRRNAVAREGRAAFPFEAERVVKTGERRRKGVAVGTKDVNVSQGATAALGQGTDAKAIPLEKFQRGARQAGIVRVVGVRGKRQHHLFRDATRAILVGVFAQGVHKVWPRRRRGVKLWTGHFQHFGNVTVGTCMAASSIRICSKLGILASLPARSVDDGASLDTPAIGIYGIGTTSHDCFLSAAQWQ